MNGAIQSPSPGDAGLMGRRWAFGNTVLDERSLELMVAGEVVRLERRPLEVLLYLLQHAGEVVTKNEIAEELWPGRVLTESVLSRCISLLRQALRDNDHTTILTVHGYGYRFAADVHVEASAAPVPPAFGFKAGDSPRLRPQWKLVERLGAGGHGEAWLARHEKTHEARVFKFALDQNALASLKREITLFRLINDSLGARAPVVSLLEWNLEEPPYFLEAEYVEGRDLKSWIDALGGLSQIPMDVRLEIVAQVADALAAAHSVGVLHKDLKPGNVLVEPGEGMPMPRVKLGDFGCGGILDPLRLEALGITRLGLSSTVGSDAAGTPIYMAPEILKGQPHTVRTDIYSLGVLLYQMVVGDLARPFAPDWDHAVQDPLLREDIAATAAGTPERRLADATHLAERLRSLEARRSERAAESVAMERAERSRRLVTDLRRARIFAIALLGLAGIAIAGGFAAYQARGEAIKATETSRAVSDFLMEDVLAVDPAAERPKDASYESLLGRAATQVDTRFKNYPEAAASIHWLLGRRYQEIGVVRQATDHYERAKSLLGDLGSESDAVALVSYRLVPIYIDRGQRHEAAALARQLRTDWEHRHGTHDLSTYLVRTWVAHVLVLTGEYTTGENELRDVLNSFPLAHAPSEETKAAIKQWLGVNLIADVSSLTSDANWSDAIHAFAQNELGSAQAEYADEYTDSLANLRQASLEFSRLFGENSELAAEASLDLGWVLGMIGHYDEAERLTFRATTFFNTWLPASHWVSAIPTLFLGRLRLEQGRPSSAAELFESALATCRAHGCPPRITEEVAYDLGRAYQSLAKRDEAIRVLRDSLVAYERLRGAGHVGSLRRRLSLAEAFRESGLAPMAEATLSQIPSDAFAALPPRHQVIADYRRLQGLLAFDRGQFQLAAPALEDAAEMTSERFGPQHWRTERVRKELQKAAAQAART